MTMLEKAIEAAGEVPATSIDDVRHVLSARAIEEIARADLLAVRDAGCTKDMWESCYVEGDQMLPDYCFTAMIDAILSEKPE